MNAYSQGIDPFLYHYHHLLSEEEELGLPPTLFPGSMITFVGTSLAIVLDRFCDLSDVIISIGFTAQSRQLSRTQQHFHRLFLLKPIQAGPKGWESWVVVVMRVGMGVMCGGDDEGGDGGGVKWRGKWKGEAVMMAEKVVTHEGS